MRFLSAARGANSRGNTADLLLVANEAQDIDPDVWDAVFAPMAASANATTLYMGTVWSSVTLLARQLRLLRDLERADGVQRVYRVPWRQVAAELPAYGAYVRRQVALLGEQHPFIRTEYELEELDGGGRLFPSERQALLRGAFPPCCSAARRRARRGLCLRHRRSRRGGGRTGRRSGPTAPAMARLDGAERDARRAWRWPRRPPNL